MAGNVTIVEDTRQQSGKHDLKHEGWAADGVSVIRSKLAHGDYALPPTVAVDTKKDIYELASDIDHQHDRFKGELVGAMEAGTKLVVLVENEDGVGSLDDLAGWVESDPHFHMRRRRSGNRKARRISGARLAKACKTMEERYGVRFEFCDPRCAARRVVEILMKEAGE